MLIISFIEVRPLLSILLLVLRYGTHLLGLVFVVVVVVVVVVVQTSKAPTSWSITTVVSN
jgi:hypothetical protein